MSKKKFTPVLDPSGYIKSGNTGLKNWQAVNEIIANSIDSWQPWIAKKDLIIKIDLDNKQNNLEKSKLRITDNAEGMSEEEIMTLFSFFKSNKPQSSYADKYLGLYGFGFKAATAKIGKKVTVISSNSNKEYYKISVNYEELASSTDAPDLSIETIKHDSSNNKIFNGSPTGTIVEISSFNSSFPVAVLFDWLPVSWKKFMTGELYEKKLKLYVGNEISKSNIVLPYSLDINNETIKELDVKFQWRDDQKNIIHGVVKGYFGFRTDSTKVKMATQGLNIYRHGQLIERYSHSFYMGGSARHNSRNTLVGEIEIGINVNTIKNAIEDTDASQAMLEALNKEFSKYSNSITNMTKAVASGDNEIINLEIARFREKHDLSLTASQKKIMQSTGNIDEDITEIKPEESPSTEVPTTPTISTKVNFKLLDWNKFKLDKKEYSVEFTPYNTESNSPYTLLNVSGNSLPIYIYIKHPKGKIIEKALKNKEKNDESNLICAILVSEAVKKLMEIQNYSGKEIINIKNIIMNS